MVLNYERYIRLRTVFKRLEGSPELSNWLSHPLVLALGGLSVGPNCRLLFAKEVFDYPELEDHELLCNHLGKFSSLGSLSLGTRSISLFEQNLHRHHSIIPLTDRQTELKKYTMYENHTV